VGTAGILLRLTLRFCKVSLLLHSLNSMTSKVTFENFYQSLYGGHGRNLAAADAGPLDEAYVGGAS